MEVSGQLYVPATLPLGKQSPCPLDGMLGRVSVIKTQKYIFMASFLIEYRDNIFYVTRIIINIYDKLYTKAVAKQTRMKTSRNWVKGRERAVKVGNRPCLVIMSVGELNQPGMLRNIQSMCQRFSEQIGVIAFMLL
jgi:hypothetical protein